jgi:lysophospholipase L1-like esterase
MKPIVRLAFIAFALTILRPDLIAQTKNGEHWVGTWATAVVARPMGALGLGPFGRGGPSPQAAASQAPAPQPSQPATPPAADAPPAPPAQGRGPAVPPLNLNDQTIRQIVHTTIGGERARVVFSNAFGTGPLTIGAAHVALRDAGARTVVQSDRTLTFSGAQSTTVPPGAVELSDPVNLTIPTMTDLAIDLYLPGDVTASVGTVTTHTGALQTNYVSPTGNHAGVADMPVTTTTASWFFLSRVEVTAPEQVAVVVAFGDSITDGTRSTIDTNNRWPDQFARRALTSNMKLAVLNEGIAGNRVLSDGAGVSALARFDRDALVQTGVTHIIVLESINDIGLARENPSPSVDDLIAGHKQLIERAHARGIRIYGATLTPFEGAAYATTPGEAKRQALNQWIRTSKAYDGVVDFDAAVRDPSNPAKILPQFNPGDNLHMNDAGYQAMANAVDLALFKRK